MGEVRSPSHLPQPHPQGHFTLMSELGQAVVIQQKFPRCGDGGPWWAKGVTLYRWGNRPRYPKGKEQGQRPEGHLQALGLFPAHLTVNS